MLGYAPKWSQSLLMIQNCSPITPVTKNNNNWSLNWLKWTCSIYIQLTFLCFFFLSMFILNCKNFKRIYKCKEYERIRMLSYLNLIRSVHFDKILISNNCSQFKRIPVPFEAGHQALTNNWITSLLDTSGLNCLYGWLRNWQKNRNR